MKSCPDYNLLFQEPHASLLPKMGAISIYFCIAMENRCFELCFYFSKVTSYFKLFHVKFPKTTAMLSSTERAGMNQINHYSALTGPVGPLEILKQDETQ